MKLVLVDSMVIVHQIFNAAIRAFGEEEWTLRHKIYLWESLLWANGAGWLPVLEQIDCKVVWLRDSKPYWRNLIYPEYKANRKKHPLFPWAVESFEEFRVMPLGDRKPVEFVTIGFPGFEADDVAAMIVQLWSKAESSPFDRILLATIDSDWMGMIRDRKVLWLCAGNHAPRIRERKDCHRWVQSKWNQQGKKKKALWELPPLDLFKPPDIWEWKAAVGDTADNLKGDFDPGLVRLFQPCEGYCLATGDKYAFERDCVSSLIAHAPARPPAGKHLKNLHTIGGDEPIETLYLPMNLL